MISNINFKEQPLVSVLVITYNSSKFVIQTLESVRVQKYRNIELIISDDCSTDNTVEIVEQWIDNHRDEFLKTNIIAGEINIGTSANLNRAISASTGIWIKPIAGDDILLSDCLINNLNFAIKNKANFIFSDLSWFNENKLELEHDTKEDIFRMQFAKLNHESQLKFYCRYPVFLNSPSWFFKKNLNYVFYDEDFRFLEDQPSVYLFLTTKNRIFYLNEITIRYRKHINSVQYVSSPRFIREFKLCYKKYRVLNLSRKSFIDMLCILYHHAFIAEHWMSKNVLTKILYFPFKKISIILVKLIKMKISK